MSGAQRYRVAGAAISLMLAACAVEPLAPLPDGAVRFAPDRQRYLAWWRDVEQCAGRAGRFDAITWYVLPGAETMQLAGRDVWAYWSSASNRIVLTQQATLHESVVRHEMLHAILRVEGHPAEYFHRRCSGVV